MARSVEVAQTPQDLQEIGAGEIRTRLVLVGREAVFVKCLAGELQAGHVVPADLPVFLKHLGARLTELANLARGGACD